MMKSPTLSVGLAAARYRDRNLGRLVLDGLDHFEIASERDLAAGAVDAGPDVVFVAVLRATRLLDRLLHRFEHLVAIDALVARDGVGDLQQFGAGVNRVNSVVFLFIAWTTISDVVNVRSASEPRSAAAASSSSVRTSLPRWMSANGTSTARPSTASLTVSPSVPSSRPRKRRRPSIGRAVSILASKPANRT